MTVSSFLADRPRAFQSGNLNFYLATIGILLVIILTIAARGPRPLRAPARRLTPHRPRAIIPLGIELRKIGYGVDCRIPAAPVAPAGVGCGAPREAIWLDPFCARIVGELSVVCRGAAQINWARRSQEKIGDRDAVRW